MLDCVRNYLLVALLAVAACGGADAQRAAPTTTRVRTTTAPTTAPPTTTTTTLVPIPADPVLAECQTVVNAALGEWAFDDELSTAVRCVSDAELPGIGGSCCGAAGYVGTIAFVKADSTYPSEELRAWRFRSTAAHELGHAWTLKHLTLEQRARYMALRGYAGDWDASKANEDYADVFSLLMSGLGDQTITTYLGTPGFGRSPIQIGERPSPEQIAAICAERLVPC